MNYAKHYGSLIERAKNRPAPSGCVELHHVKPRCLGGGDEPANLVAFTAREHFVAHQLLVKMHPGNRALAYAAFAMGNEGGRRHAWLRAEHAKAVSGAANPMKDPVVAAKVSAKLMGRVFSEEAKKKMSEARTGERHPNFGRKVPAHAEAMRGANNPARRPDVRRKQSDALKGRAKPLVACDRCGRLMDVANMKRWHSHCASEQLLKGAESEQRRIERSIP